MPKVVGVLDLPATAMFVLDAGASDIALGVAGVIGPIDFRATVEAGSLLADASGDIVVDLWKGTLAEYIAGTITNGDSITASAPLTISGALGSEDTVLTGWITDLPAGTVLVVNVDSCTGIHRVTGRLKIRRA